MELFKKFNQSTRRKRSLKKLLKSWRSPLKFQSNSWNMNLFILKITVQARVKQFQSIQQQSFCCNNSNCSLQQQAKKLFFSRVQIENILKILVTDKENHPIKKITHERIIKKFIEHGSSANIKKWIHIFSTVITPIRYFKI